MALWGKFDAKSANTGTVDIAANGLVSGSSTLFDSEAAVGDYIVANSKKYRITSITSNTVAQVEAGTLGGAIATASANAYTLQEAPIYVSASEVGADANNVFGVDTTEVGITQEAGHAGWVRRTAGSGGRSGRVQYEVLVASGSISGDNADDTQLPDYTITIGTQPADDESATGAAVTFAVVATTSPAGGSLSYQWQLSTDSGSSWSNISAAGVYSDVTTDTLAISDNTGLDGNQYRVVVSVTGGADVTSDAATLTEAA